jgi:hypothetical protein
MEVLGHEIEGRVSNVALRTKLNELGEANLEDCVAPIWRGASEFATAEWTFLNQLYDACFPSARFESLKRGRVA